MFRRSKPPCPTLLDGLAPWPIYVLSAALVGVVLFALINTPFWLGRAGRSSQGRTVALR